MKGLILEVLTVESVTVVDVAEMGRRKREKKRAQDSIWGIMVAGWHGSDGEKSLVKSLGHMVYGSQGSQSFRKEGRAPFL